VVNLQIYTARFKSDFLENGTLQPEVHGFVQQDEYMYYNEQQGIYLFPAAWQKPGRILFATKCGDHYVLILGDETICVARNWGPISKTSLAETTDEQERKRELDLILALREPGQFLTGYLYIPATLVAFLLGIFIMRRLNHGNCSSRRHAEFPDKRDPGDQ